MLSFEEGSTPHQVEGTQPTLTTRRLSRQATFDEAEWKEDDAGSEPSEDNLEHSPGEDDVDGGFILDLIQQPQNGMPTAR